MILNDFKSIGFIKFLSLPFSDNINPNQGAEK